MPRYARAARGFSLIEALIGMAVVAVLVTLAAPGFRKVLVKQQVDGAADDLLADLQTARGFAISRGQLVGIQSNAGGWRQGWRIQADAAPAIAGYSADGTTPLRRHEAVPDGVDVSADRDGALSVVVFAADGSVYDAAAGARATTDTAFMLCKPSGALAQAMRVTVRASGHMKSHRDGSVTGASCR